MRVFAYCVNARFTSLFGGPTGFVLGSGQATRGFPPVARQLPQIVHSNYNHLLTRIFSPGSTKKGTPVAATGDLPCVLKP